ncbi:MAG TPA: hypothetical protein EYG86_09090 [Crocinitomicaceae bacterium]|nr:hypothetical protein [Crocinitomicaceae bacterium]
MKKIFFTLIAVLTLAMTGFSQDAQKVAATEGQAALQKSKVTKVYTYTLPSNITQDHIDKVSKYYASYFTIAFDASTQQAVVTMNSEMEKGEMVMGRFLSSCQVREVKVDDTLLSLDQFMKEYLK